MVQMPEERWLRQPPFDPTPATPTQTLGPYQYPPGSERYMETDELALPGAEGQHITVRGRVSDAEKGTPLSGAILEVWQATSTGRYDHANVDKAHDTQVGKLDPNVRHYIRVRTDASGIYSFKTVKPAGYPVGSDPSTATWWRPPHIHFRVRATGFKDMVTQMYFSDDVEANEKDELQRLLTAEQRGKLQVAINSDGVGIFDLVLSRRGYPGVGKHVRPWDMGVVMNDKKYRSGTTEPLPPAKL